MHNIETSDHLYQPFIDGYIEHIKIIEHENASNPNFTLNKYRAFCSAIEYGHFDIVKYLLTESIWRDAYQDIVEDGIYKAIEENQPFLLNYLLNSSDVQSEPIISKKFFLITCDYDHKECLEILIRSKTDLWKQVSFESLKNAIDANAYDIIDVIMTSHMHEISPSDTLKIWNALAKYNNLTLCRRLMSLSTFIDIEQTPWNAEWVKSTCDIDLAYDIAEHYLRLASDCSLVEKLIPYFIEHSIDHYLKIQDQLSEKTTSTEAVYEIELY